MFSVAKLFSPGSLQRSVRTDRLAGAAIVNTLYAASQAGKTQGNSIPIFWRIERSRNEPEGYAKIGASLIVY